ncbi:nitroreductase family protein [Kribbella sandramycini]|uniref:Nitroreductase n=1 Tax=Kribbella sandramycini TaxID=60450 RepID=A0A841SMP3_9ACTN|nr:nitroreductase [Kribbella sandramycini]
MSTLDLTPDELLTTTRAVRKRLDLSKPVPLELIKECIEIALQAPSGSNRQGWHWLVITDPEHRKTIAEYYRTALHAYFATQEPADDPVQARVKASSEYLGDHLAEVPVFVIPCIKAGALPEGNQAGLWGSILPAAWNFMLAARARGLGTTWTSLHLNYEQEIAQLLGIPGDIRQAVLIPTAYTIGTDFKPGPRKSLDDVVHFDTW